MVDTDGSIITGLFKNGKLNGPGKLTGGCPGENCGSSYEGGYKDGKFEGQGELVDTDGTIITGLFKDGKLNGPGKRTGGCPGVACGISYDGGFKDGKFEGQGTKTYVNGDKERGIWKKGKCKGCKIIKCNKKCRNELKKNT